MGDQKKLYMLCLSSYFYSYYISDEHACKLAFARNDLRELSLYVSVGLEICVGRKYGQSEEAVYASGFFVP